MIASLLAQTTKQKRNRRNAMLLATIGLVLFWAVPLTFIGSLAQIDVRVSFVGPL